MRTIVIGDCHGQPHLISNALEHAKYDVFADELVFAGDIVDIDSDEGMCLDLLVDNEAIILIGNHDAAMLLGRVLHPQQWHEPDFVKRYMGIKKQIAVSVDEKVLVTHAGLSFEAHYEMFEDNHPRVSDVAHKINESSLVELYRQYHGVLWYRPYKHKLWYNGFKQVAGHTPARYAENNMKPLGLVGLYLVDPFYPGFGKKSFRYAEIIDGEVEVFSR